MREIKFRRYVKPLNYMQYDAEQDPMFYHYLYDRQVVIMQYTGIDDKNGKRIYEGDLVQIVGNEADGMFIVVWSNEDSMYMLSDANEEFERLCEYDYVVKGNIYENSYLLEG